MALRRFGSSGPLSTMVLSVEYQWAGYTRFRFCLLLESIIGILGPCESVSGNINTHTHADLPTPAPRAPVITLDPRKGPPNPETRGAWLPRSIKLRS